MTVEEFDAFRLRLVRQYAADHVRAGNWTAAEAHALAAGEIDALLPRGVETGGMVLLAAEDPEAQLIGFAWVAIEHEHRRGAWLYDIWVAPDQRGRGYGRALLSVVEAEVQRRGSDSMGLNVFGDNAVARELYDSSGYDVAALQMRKRLPGGS
jgi:ribosomal protein S18 acetylase RimI-like enzyme